MNNTVVYLSIGFAMLIVFLIYDIIKKQMTLNKNTKLHINVGDYITVPQGFNDYPADEVKVVEIAGHTYRVEYFVTYYGAPNGKIHLTGWVDESDIIAHRKWDEELETFIDDMIKF